MYISNVKDKSKFVLLILAGLVILAIVVKVLLLVFFPKIVLIDKSGQKYQYQKSALFEEYLDKWGIISNKPFDNPFGDKKYLVNRLTLTVSDSPPAKPSQLVVDKGTTPPTTVSSVKEDIVDKDWNVSIYINPTYSKKPNYFERNLLWLTLYTIYKRGNPKVSNDQISKDVKPYYDSLVDDDGRPSIFKHEK